MEFNKDVEKKNPIFWALVAVVIGITLSIWGWLRNDATTAQGAKGSTVMIVSGILFLAGGLVSWFVFGSKKKK